jgi:hypothetical protein
MRCDADYARARAWPSRGLGGKCFFSLPLLGSKRITAYRHCGRGGEVYCRCDRDTPCPLLHYYYAAVELEWLGGSLYSTRSCDVIPRGTHLLLTSNRGSPGQTPEVLLLQDLQLKLRDLLKPGCNANCRLHLPCLQFTRLDSMKRLFSALWQWLVATRSLQSTSS